MPAIKQVNYFNSGSQPLALKVIMWNLLLELETRTPILQRSTTAGVFPQGTNRFPIPIPNNIIVYDINAPTVQDLQPNAVEGQINKYASVRIGASSLATDYSMAELLDSHLKPAVSAIASKIEDDAVAVMCQTPIQYATKVSTEFSFQDMITGMNAMEKMGYSQEAHPMYCTLSTAHMSLMNSANILGFANAQTQEALRTGSIGQTLGFEVTRSHNIPVKTKGTTVIPTWTASNLYGSILTKGSTFLVIYNANNTTLVNGDSIYVPKSDSWHTITNVTSPTTGYRGLTINPPLQDDLVLNDVVMVQDYGGNRSLFYSKTSLVYATMVPPVVDQGYGGGIMSTVSDPKTGLSLRLREYMDPDSAKKILALDVFYGIVAVQPAIQIIGG